MDTTIVNTGNGNIINAGGGGNVDTAIQVSSSSTEGAESNNATDRTEVVAGNGNAGRDTEVTSEVQTEKVSSEISEDEKALEDYVNASIGKDLASYNALTIKRLYPKGWEAFIAYCKSLAGDAEHMDDETAIGLILAAPRTVLPGFFDSKGIYVNTEFGSDNKWAFTISTKDIQHGYPFSYSSRVTAETAAFLKAFEIFESK